MTAMRAVIPDVSPHNLEAERSVLGAILVDNDAYAVAATLVDGASFYRVAHQRAFEAMADLFARGSRVDLVILNEELKRRGDLEEVGGPAYVAALVDGVPYATNVRYYSSIVREKAMLRKLIMAGRRLVDEAHAAEEPAAKLAERGTDLLLSCIDTRDGGLVQADAAVADYAKSLDDKEARPIIPTGFTDIDTLVKLRPGNLVIVAARPSVGKTSWMLGAADHMAMHGHPAVMFSLEMERDQIAARLLASRSNVQARRLEEGTACQTEYAQVARALDAQSALLLETTATTVTEIGAWCRRAKQMLGGLTGVFVDYMQMMSADRARDSRESEMAAISRGLKRVAKEHGVVVVALSQLNRHPDGRRDKRPQLSDLRESGALEQDCDVALLLFREEMHRPTDDNQGVAEAIVAKNRDGPTGVVRLAWRSELSQFRNLAQVR